MAVAAAIWLVATAVVIFQSLALSAHTIDPRIAIGSGFASVEVSEQAARQLARPGTRDALLAARQEALTTYRFSPLAADALDTILAVDAALGNTDEKAALLAAGAPILARKPAFSLLSLREAATAGDARAMAWRADRLLRTNRVLGDLVTPLLIAETSNPRFADEFAKRLALRPAWRLNYLVASGLDKQHGPGTLAVLRALRHMNSGPDANEVWSYFAAGGRSLPAPILRQQWLELDPGVNHDAAKSAVYDHSFVGLTGSAPFNWSFDQALADAVFERDENGKPYLAVRSRRSDAIEFARQTLVLAEGQHQLVISAGLIDPQTSSDGVQNPRLRVALSCLDGRPLGMINQPLLPVAQSYALTFAVPNACAGQTLALGMEPGFGNTSSGVRINAVDIR